ncbi:MAG: tetratricopeptide repeat protein, partial [Acidobacteria bacterium]|nr:tetratricopeptide repeat protein [Acidobacteriota bacterium]
MAAFHQARYREALDHYREALEEAGRDGAPAGVRGRIERGMGACWIALSDYRAALETLARARADTLAGGSREDLAAVDANLAAAHLYQGDLDSARRIYRRALGLLAESPRSPHRWAIVTSLTAIELRRERYSQAIDLLGPVLRAAQASGDRGLEAAARDLIGFGYLGLGDFGRARDSFSRSLEARGGESARSLTYLGMTELKRGSPEVALGILARSAAVAQQEESPVELWKALYWRGRSYWDLRQWDAAAADLRSAVEVLQSIRSRVAPADGLRVQYEVSHSKVYSALAELLCERERVAEAFEAVELERGQSLRALIEA